MKLTCVKVNGYKNLVNCEYNMDSFNVLIGANNSGKSNLLEIFGFLDALLFGSDNTKHVIASTGVFPGRGYVKSKCDKSEKCSISIELEFNEDIESSNYRYWYFIKLEYFKKRVLSNDSVEMVDYGWISSEYLRYKNSKMTGIPKTVFERTGNEITRSAAAHKIEKIDASEAVVALITKIKDISDSLEASARRGVEMIQLIAGTPVLYSSAYDIKNQPKGTGTANKMVINNGRISAVDIEEEIAKIINSEDKDYFQEILSDILNIKKINVLYLGKQGAGPIDIRLVVIEFNNGIASQINGLSDGTAVALNLITCLFSNKYPVIAIEELENSIHPRLLKKLIRLIKNNFSHVQVILTTHSPVLLGMVQLDEVSIITNKENGEARIERVKDKKELVKKLSGPFSSFSDIFYISEE